MTKPLLDNNFFVDGVQVTHSDSLVDLIDRIWELFDSLADEKSELLTSPIDRFRIYLTHMFDNDRTKFFGLLKALASTPAIVSLSTHPDVLRAVEMCGIKNPTLVTPPILHVVSQRLMENKDKVVTPFHQDVTSTLGSVGQVVVWIPLHTVSRDNYAISATLGSHKNGILETKQSEFGLGVSDTELFENQDQVIELIRGQILLFSSYLVHRTLSHGDFRIAASFRFNDLGDESWVDRNYFNPFQRSYDSSMYDINRTALTKNLDYFNKFNGQSN